MTSLQDCDPYATAAHIFYHGGGSDCLSPTEQQWILGSFAAKDYHGGLKFVPGARFFPLSEVLGRMVWGWQNH